jgi:hypothetical protein
MRRRRTGSARRETPLWLAVVAGMTLGLGLLLLAFALLAAAHFAAVGAGYYFPGFA